MDFIIEIGKMILLGGGIGLVFGLILRYIKKK